MAKKWIQSAIKHPGALTKSAKSAGMSTHAFAEKHKHSKGKAGKRARLALTLSKMHHSGPSKSVLKKHGVG